METARTKTFETLIATLGTTLLLLTLFLSPIKWIFQSLQATEYRLHSILLIGLLIFLAIKNHRREFLVNRFEIRPASFIVFVAGLLGFLITEKLFDIDVISCLFFGLTIYGFVGFLIDQKKWKDSAVFVLLFFVCLPLSYHIETFLGFPLRLASAKAAEAFFSLTNHQVHSVETILSVENKLAHIDLPCSGMKSLWSISLFSLILSIVEKYKLNLAWVVAFACGCLFVASANIFRIIMLVLIYNSSLPETAKEALHAPVGLIGFIVACLATYWIFRLFCKQTDSETSKGDLAFSKKSFATVVGFLIAAIAVNQVQFVATAETKPIQQIQSTKDSLQLTEKETDLFLRHGVIRYEKKKFDTLSIRGTAFLVLSKSWRGHHHPEQCLEGQGRIIEASRTLTIEHYLQVRSIDIKNSNHEVIYWFQSNTDSTDDYSSSVWSGLVSPHKPYTMVSLYIENGKTADSSAYIKLIKDFHNQAQVMLENGGNDEK